MVTNAARAGKRHCGRRLPGLCAARAVAATIVRMKQPNLRLCGLVCAWVFALAACTSPPAELPPAAPESASGWQAKAGRNAQRFMIAAAHPLAADAGHAVLREGGSALDAAVAAQLVLALVEPQSSGIGGGAFLMHWDGRNVQAWDGRETAPAAATGQHFFDAGGKPVPFEQAQFGGRAVATPGLLKMLEAAHRQHGLLPWPRLVEPAIRLAEQGFPIGPRLHSQLTSDVWLKHDAQAGAYFYRADGTPHPVGHVLRNPALAAVLRAVAQHGSAALYSGPLAQDLVARVRGHSVPGLLSMADLAGYTPLQRQPMCQLWRELYRVCGFPPPSSGHIALMQILTMVEPMFGLDEAGLHRYIEASRLAFADRAQHVADPDFVAAPGGDWQLLLDPGYLAKRAALIGPASMQSAAPGQPGTTSSAFAPMPDQPEHGTSHVSVIDGQGRAVALTSTIEAQFGARIMADGGSGLPGGYLLNNQMTDFALAPADAQGRPVANRVQPGKRPRSSMSPTLVFDAREGPDQGRLLMTLGSAGGPAIIHFTAKTLLGTLVWGLDAQRAIDLPNFSTTGGPTGLERGRFETATVQALRQRGHSVVEIDLTSGLQAIQRTPQGYFGGADPRREGTVRGD